MRMTIAADKAPFNTPRVSRKEPTKIEHKLLLAAQPSLQIDEKARTIHHLISTTTVDRDGEVLVSKGCITKEFSLNPIVLLNHQPRELPIGRSLGIEVFDTEVWSTTQFAGLAQNHPKAETVWACYKSGFMRAFSVGFLVLKATMEKMFPEQTGKTALSWNLLEVSCVGLPSNIYAVTQFAKAFGLPDGATEHDLAEIIGVTPLARYWQVAEQILPAETARVSVNHDDIDVKVMPAPKPDESEDDFITRCMGNTVMASDYPDADQRAAVCHAQYGKGPKKALSNLEAKAGVNLCPSNEETEDAYIERCRGVRSIEELRAIYRQTADTLRWNRDLSAKLFDVTRERNPAATREIELAARYLDCEIKELSTRDMVFAGTKMGAGLVALDEAIGEFSVEDVRHFVQTHGPNREAQQAEAPPEHDVIRLNSTLRRSFLLNGTRFMRKSDGKLVVRVAPEWSGIAVTVYGKGADLTDEFCDRVRTRAASLKFYKGESFSLSGEFLDATEETWDDVFLTPGNEKALKRVVELMNTKGAAMENRGVIMLGEPGTGKTLAARVMRNETRGRTTRNECQHGVGLCTGGDCGKPKTLDPATFIWISARDFYRLGAFGGIDHAFDIAKENAPSMLLFEDVDNWIGRGEIDLLKTTMDGAARTKGIVTVLTTNDPAHFPTALIDRPGRFHDVLKVDLPDADQRRRMLMRWMPDIGIGGKYSEDQPRDEGGQWTEGGGSSGGSGAGRGESEGGSDGSSGSGELRPSVSELDDLGEMTSSQLAQLSPQHRALAHMRANVSNEMIRSSWDGPRAQRDGFAIVAGGASTSGPLSLTANASMAVIASEYGKREIVAYSVNKKSLLKGVGGSASVDGSSITVTDRKAADVHVVRRNVGVLKPDKNSVLEEVVAATGGYSGAHVRELARFAGIIREQDGIESPDEAIKLALVKVREQRDLIGETHAAQGRYAPRAAVVEAVKATTPLVRDTKTTDAIVAAIRKKAAEQIEAIEDEADVAISRNREEVFRLRGDRALLWSDVSRDRKSFSGFESCGYTAPASGASSPTHVHDYELKGDDAGAFEEGCAYEVADHKHRITAASLARGETEASDGHTHALMTAADVMAALTQTPVFTLGVSDLETKDGRVLAATNYAKLKMAHPMVAEVIAAHDASRPAPEDKPEDKPDEKPKTVLNAASLAEEIAARMNGALAASETDAEIWFDRDALTRDLRVRLGGALSPGAAGR
jgi:hypothetical protein